MAVKIYLAGPDVFLPNARAVGAEKRRICAEFGFEGLYPLDQNADIAGDPAQIFQANCGLMQQADAGLFNLTPFRGPSADAGTVFELGFLFALGKPVAGYSSAVGSYRERVAASAGPLRRDADGWRDRQGFDVEDFAHADNLMITEALARSGGLVIVGERAGDDWSLPAMQAFRLSVKELRQRVDSM